MKKRKTKRKRYRLGPSNSRPGSMMLVVKKGKQRVHCACGRDHGVLDEIKAEVDSGWLARLGNDHHVIVRAPIELGGIIYSIIKIACACGMRARYGTPSCDDGVCCLACGRCIRCAACACRDENPFGSYR